MRVACIQISSRHKVEHNLETVAQYLEKAAKAKVQLALLPEDFSCIAKNENERLANAKKYPMILDFLCTQAKHNHLWVIAGSTLAPIANSEKLHNRSLIIAPDGNIQSEYDKMHLFDASLDTETWKESEQTEAGSSPVMQAIDASWKVGVSICYDLRFPELYRHYSQHGCHILTVAAAFTVPTGKAHWEVLLRARAIENQCYVLAAAQYGTHDDGRKTYGHSMIINPWGEIIAELPTGEGMITADLSYQTLEHIRQSLPALQHRRIG
jgi:nitrilase